MATAEAIREQIREAEARLEQSEADTLAARRALSAADERQKLRRQLDAIEEEIRGEQEHQRMLHSRREGVDADMAGCHKPDSNGQTQPTLRRAPADTVQIANCRTAVVYGEQEWRIEGMSWLKNALKQACICRTESRTSAVGSHDLVLVYQPQSERQMGHPGDQFPNAAKGSLALRHDSECGITFRYSFYVKRGDEWVQWGETANACHPHSNTSEWYFGPDVEEFDDEVADGVFGLSHEELLGSEWVENDTLTVKVKLEVRNNAEIGRLESSKRRVDVPPNTMAAEFLAVLEGGEDSDVVFVVEGQELNAHSFPLCARCVLKKPLPVLSGV